MHNIIDRIEEGFSFIKEKLGDQTPLIGIILGSGFAEWTSQLHQILNIPYSAIPGFSITSVPGHTGNLILAAIEGNPILIMQGRFHFYEGHSMPVLSIPVRIFKKLGIKTLILTNAAGSINTLYEPGDIMLIEDHINLLQNNPLIGPNADEFGTRFPDASEVYTKSLLQLALQTANDLGMRAHKGTYVFASGPAFETPAEIRMMRTIGADAVGMSTVPEAITACHAGLQVVGISLIANLASGMAKHPLTHHDVMETMQRVAPKLNHFLEMLVARLIRIQAESRNL